MRVVPSRALIFLLGLVTVPAVAGAEGGRGLSSLEAVRLGVSRSLDLRVLRLDQQRAQALARAAWQPYSPALYASSAYSSVPTPLVPFPLTQVAQEIDSTVGVSWRSPWGTQLTAGAEMDQALTGSGSGANPSASSLSVNLTQPLLKDGWARGASLPLVEARLNAAIQLEVYRHQRNLLIVALETAYWDLALAAADVGLKTRSRERAQQQFEDTAENVKRGILAETEIYVVQENVVIFDQDLIRARQDLAQARRQLAELMALAPGEAIEASEELTPPVEPLPDRAAAVDLALRSHPRILEQHLRVELGGARRAWWANQTLPAVGLTGGLALRGWDAATGTGWNQVFTSPATEARVGLTFSLPLDRGAVSASLRRAEIDLEQAEAVLKRTEDSVRYEVENAWAELDTNLRVLSLARRQEELAELKLTAQVGKYQSGLSTLADIVRFQRDLDVAHGAAQRVVRSTRVGRARLLAALGTLAETAGAKVE